MPDDDTLLDALDRLVNAPPPGDPEQTLLTATHREYLRGKEPDLDPSTERTRRRTIRKRLRHSWIDTAVAFEGLAPEDCAQLLLRREGNTKPLHDYSGIDEHPGPPELFWSHLITGETTDSPVIGTGGLRQVFGLGFHSLYEALVVQSNWADQQYEQVLEALVAESMRDALAKSGRNASIDVNIEIDDDDRDELPAEIDSLEDLRSCFAHRQLQPDEYWEILDIDR